MTHGRFQIFDGMVSPVVSSLIFSVCAPLARASSWCEADAKERHFHREELANGLDRVAAGFRIPVAR